MSDDATKALDRTLKQLRRWKGHSRIDAASMISTGLANLGTRKLPRALVNEWLLRLAKLRARKYNPAAARANVKELLEQPFGPDSEIVGPALKQLQAALDGLHGLTVQYLSGGRKFSQPKAADVLEQFADECETLAIAIRAHSA